MSKFLASFRCPCCNEPLTDWEVSMYDMFDGMKEDCYQEAMASCYEDEILLRDIDIENNSINY